MTKNEQGDDKVGTAKQVQMTFVTLITLAVYPSIFAEVVWMGAPNPRFWGAMTSLQGLQIQYSFLMLSVSAFSPSELAWVSWLSRTL